MKLFNVIVTWDVYVVAEDAGPAQEAALELIQAKELRPTYSAGLEIAASPVRAGWKNERPLVAGDVSDDDFARIKGKTTQQVYDLLHKKAGK